MVEPKHARVHYFSIRVFVCVVVFAAGIKAAVLPVQLVFLLLDGG